MYNYKIPNRRNSSHVIFHSYILRHILFPFSCSLEPESFKVPIKQFFFNILNIRIFFSFFNKNNYYHKACSNLFRSGTLNCVFLHVQTFSFPFKVCFDIKSRKILRVSFHVLLNAKSVILK